MTTYYHCTPMRLAPESVIEPGNWGRLIENYYTNESADNRERAYSEVAFEYGRSLFAPNAPSRLNCIFACPDLAGITSYQEENYKTGIINEVEPLSQDSPIHVTSYRLIGQGTSQELVLANFFQRVKSYWQDSPETDIEVLIGGPVRIRRVIG